MTEVKVYIPITDEIGTLIVLATISIDSEGCHELKQLHAVWYEPLEYASAKIDITDKCTGPLLENLTSMILDRAETMELKNVERKVA